MDSEDEYIPPEYSDTESIDDYDDDWETYEEEESYDSSDEAIPPTKARTKRSYTRIIDADED